MSEKILGIVLIIFLIFILFYAIKMRKFAPWLPTRKRDIERLMKLLGLTKNDILYELGSGDGRVASFLANQTEAKIIGIEIFPPLFWIASVRNFFMKGKKPIFLRKNIFTADFSDATHVYIFGMPESLRGELTEKLMTNLRPDAKIISYIYPYPELKLVEENRGKDGRENPFFLYEKKKSEETRKKVLDARHGSGELGSTKGS